MLAGNSATTRTGPPRPSRPPAEQLGGFYESIPEGIYIGALGSKTIETLSANPHMKLMFGFDPDRPDGQVRPFADDRFVDERARADFLARLRRDGTVSNYLIRLRRADDSPMWVEVTAALQTADGPGPPRLDALVRDVSERHRLEAQGRDPGRQLVQSEKMAALGQTISGVAHELNNPLATILTRAERLASRPLATEAKRGVETILGEAERAARIVKNLLAFARNRNTTRVVVDMNDLVRDTLALRAYEQRLTNISTLQALARGLPCIFSDPHQVKQVLLNLMVNAEQAMLAANGRGSIVARSWYDAAEGMVALEINDDGPGIPAEVQTRIFDPFFTTKAIGKGTGLGLTVAYAIVQEHGGRIRVESTPGAGTSFFVSFPAVAGPAPRAAPTAASLPASPAGARVLLVEDEPALAAAVAEALTDAGYRIERAADGEEALERVAGRPFDLVICDLKMPRLDGRAFYRLLRERNPSLTRRIIFVTGDVAGTDAHRFLVETGCRWLAKPFRLHDLLRRAHEVLS